MLATILGLLFGLTFIVALLMRWNLIEMREALNDQIEKADGWMDRTAAANSRRKELEGSIRALYDARVEDRKAYEAALIRSSADYQRDLRYRREQIEVRDLTVEGLKMESQDFAVRLYKAAGRLEAAMEMIGRITNRELFRKGLKGRVFKLVELKPTKKNLEQANKCDIAFASAVEGMRRDWAVATGNEVPAAKIGAEVKAS